MYGQAFCSGVRVGGYRSHTGAGDIRAPSQTGCPGGPSFPCGALNIRLKGKLGQSVRSSLQINVQCVLIRSFI